MTDDVASDTSPSIETGTAVYDHEGNELGIIVGSTNDSFEVSIDEKIKHVDEQEHEPGQEFGEGYLVWRCNTCGEVGALEGGLPSECPNCGSEHVSKQRED